MAHPQSSVMNRPSSIRRGFTLVECLIGLAISAMLLAAIAVAFNASVTSYAENEDMFWTINNARGTLARMTTQIRNAGYLWEESPGVFKLVAVDASEPSHRCSFRTPEPECGDYTYEFRADERRLYLLNNTASTEHVLCDNVAAASFAKTATTNGDCKSVQILLTVESGGVRRTLSAAAVVRRNLGS